jgi:hypothetical protein
MLDLIKVIVFFIALTITVISIIRVVDAYIKQKEMSLLPFYMGTLFWSVFYYLNF